MQYSRTEPPNAARAAGAVTDLDGQAVTTLGAASTDHAASAARLHANQKTVGALTSHD
jgi:hypothetical protein